MPWISRRELNKIKEEIDTLAGRVAVLERSSEPKTSSIFSYATTSSEGRSWSDLNERFVSLCNYLGIEEHHVLEHIEYRKKKGSK